MFQKKFEPFHWNHLSSAFNHVKHYFPILGLLEIPRSLCRVATINSLNLDIKTQLHFCDLSLFPRL